MERRHHRCLDPANQTTGLKIPAIRSTRHEHNSPDFRGGCPCELPTNQRPIGRSVGRTSVVTRTSYNKIARLRKGWRLLAFRSFDPCVLTQLS
jgi:hypothetical protein